GSGIGAALCRRFAELGAKRVVVADLSEESARAVSSSFNGIPVRCNVAQEMDVRRLISIAEAVAGPIDIFVANAGIPSNGGYE
ncbi:ZSD1, partial [Symbiodinium sp. CCMP2456]